MSESAIVVAAMHDHLAASLPRPERARTRRSAMAHVDRTGG